MADRPPTVDPTSSPAVAAGGVDATSSVAPSSSSSTAVGNDTRRRQRGQVSAACMRCRKKKVKCDALRPACTPCAQHQLECEYETEQGETHFQSVKRRCDELTCTLELQRRRLDVFNALVDLMRTEDGSIVEELVRRIQAGQDPEAVVSSLRSRTSRNHLPMLRGLPIWGSPP